MNKNVKKAILKILLLKEEFSNKEIEEAIKYIAEEDSYPLSLLIEAKNNPKKSRSRYSKNSHDIYIERLNELKKSDEYKYNLLKNIESLISENKILVKFTSLKDFALKFSKDFTPGKTKKESIPNLMLLLSEISPEVLKEEISYLLEIDKISNSGFSELTDYLIKTER